MNKFFSTLTLGAALFGAVSLQTASANLSVTSNPTSPASGLTFLNLGAAIGPGSYTGVGYSVVANTAGNQGFVQGALGGQYAIPVTGPNVNNVTQTYAGTYLSTGLTGGNGFGTVTFNFTAPVTKFALLWGSVDPSNQLDFLFNGSSVGAVTGTGVAASPNGFQGYGGSRYVEVDSTTAFNQVVLSSGQISFEGAEFEANTATPEPGVYGMMLAGFGILGTAVMVKRRKLAAGKAVVEKV